MAWVACTVGVVEYLTLAANSPLLVALVVSIAAICVIGLFGVARWILRRTELSAEINVEETLRRAHEDVEAERARLGSSFDDGPEVSLEFYLYAGSLFEVSEKRIEIRLPIKHAECVLSRMHRSNVSNSLGAHGGLFIPMVSWINLLKQRRRLRRQAS